MTRRVLVLNGPNLGRLGSREPDVYGSTSYAGLVEACRTLGKELGLDADVRETNDEGELIRWLHEAADGSIPVIVNPGAFTHYSYGMRDAAAQRTAPLIEVHISNPYAREEFRHTSVVAPVATGHFVPSPPVHRMATGEGTVAVDQRQMPVRDGVAPDAARSGGPAAAAPGFRERTVDDAGTALSPSRPAGAASSSPGARPSAAGAPARPGASLKGDHRARPAAARRPRSAARPSRGARDRGRDPGRAPHRARRSRQDHGRQA